MSGDQKFASPLHWALCRCVCLRQLMKQQELAPPPPEGLDRIMVVGMGIDQIQRSRCSVGMSAVNMLAKKLRVDSEWCYDSRCAGMVVIATHVHHQIVLLKPQMLLSMIGISVKNAADIYQVTPEDIYMIHDQIFVSLGKFVIINEGGSSRGHHGVISCINTLNSDVMPRLLIGIGFPPHRTRRGLLHHKLGQFSEVQQCRVMQVLEQCTDYLLDDLNQNWKRGNIQTTN
uniref:peptidyl-tRNA hydrolase n=1 Tax=Pristiophorus japonicus TaxID=55135 RepID=UPI00398E3DDA